MNKIYLLFVFFLFALSAEAQEEDLLALLPEEEVTEYATASFKTNRIINGHSIENTHKGVMDFKISHRFTTLNEGVYNIFGLDGASIRFGFDFGITDNLMVGIGRNSFEKVFDGFAKYRLLRQSKGKKNMPISLSYLIDAQIVTLKWANPDRENHFWSRFYYTHQLLVARKFNDALTIQVMPTLVHRNLVAANADANDVISIGFGLRQKLNKRTTGNLEWYYVLPNQLAAGNYNSLSAGFDIETGGHVFQLHFTNSRDMTYKGFITETKEKWFYENEDGNFMSGLRFGFNMSRVFTIVKPKEF